MYIKRAMEKKFVRMSAFFKAVLVTGARQVGKTTMLRHLSKDRTYVSLDDADALLLAKQDPKLFFKLMCDASDEKGLFWLTGSEQYSMMANITESLAGRIGIMTLHPLSYQELHGIAFDAPLNLSMQGLLHREAQAKPFDMESIFDAIWRGGMPQAQSATPEELSMYFSSYVSSYVMRDVAQAGGVTDEVRFIKFLTACAANVAGQLNLNNLATVAEISAPTAKTWLSILERLHIVYLLQPYSSNKFKRLAKTPKLYFTDTGLCAYLAKWLSKDVLMNGNAAGHYFENFVLMELIKDLDYSTKNYDLTYFRDSNQKEVDLFLETGGAIHPLEIKLSASPDRREVKKYAMLENNDIPRGAGGIVCMSPTVIPITEQDSFIQVTLL